MRTLQEKYNAVLEGNFSKTQFRRDAAIEMPQFVSTVNSFDDTVAILKNKGAITEAKKQEPKYSTAKPEDQVAPDVLDTGIKFELDKKYGTLDVTPEQYEQCRAMAAKNLAKDVLYYVKQDSIQLETPAEQMEKVSLKEGKAEAWAEYQKKHNVTDKTVKVAKKDFEKEWEAGNLEETIQNIESDDQTKRRIARLTNQLLQDADPRDETVKAYAISVKNDLESGDTSRMTQYKDILSLDDLKDDMEHYLSHDVDQLEEVNEMDLNDPIAMRLRAAKMKREKELAQPKRRPLYGKVRRKVEDDLWSISQELKDLYAERGQLLIDMEQEAEVEGGPIADRYGDELNKIEDQIQALIAKRNKLEVRLDEYMSKDEIEKRPTMIKESLIHSTEVEFILPIMHDNLGHPTERPAQSEIIDAAYQALSDWYPGDEVDVRHVEQLEKAYYADFDELVANTPDELGYDVDEYKQPKYSEEELAQMAKDQQEHDEETLRRERGLEEQQLKELFKKIIAKVIND